MNEDLIIRKMRPEDKETLIQITSKIWNSASMFERVFDDWLLQSKGEFTAVEHDGELIGCAKLTYLTETDAWMQSLRKNPDAKAKGVADTVTKHFIELAKKDSNLTSLRFATYIGNHESIAVSERLGFKAIIKRSIKELEFQKDEIEKLDSAYPVTIFKDKDSIFSWLKNAEYFNKLKGLLNFDWIVHPYSDKLIEEYFIDKDMCMGITLDDEIKAIALIIFNERISLTFLDALEYKYADALISHIKTIAPEKEGKSHIELFVPDYPQMLDWLKQMGFTSWEQELDSIIYEYPLELLKL
ncbi:GNAT family N-acetyltransferase [bacterium]|nr:GNAT family N-acetyltransferase [bacterium]